MGPIFQEKHVYRGSIAPGAGFEENHELIDTLGRFWSVYTEMDEPEVSGSAYYYLLTTFNGCGESE